MADMDQKITSPYPAGGRLGDMGVQRSALLIGLLAFMMFSVGDGFTKSMAGLWPGDAVAALRYCIGAVVLSLILLWKEGVAGFIMPRPGLQFVRGLALAISTGAYFVALHALPMAVVVAIGFTAPIFTALFSAIFLRERASPVLWLVSALAFMGVLVVMQPNLNGVGFEVVLPLIGAIGTSVLIILNRLVAGAASSLQTQTALSVAAAIASVVITTIGHFSGIPMLHVGALGMVVIVKCTIVAFIATIAHYLLYLATTKASANVVAPAVYVQIPMAILIGWIVYGDIPNVTVLAGSALIIAAGLILFRFADVRP